ncbi:saccharopine dehydrogenase family protein [Actinokineospora alba]
MPLVHDARGDDDEQVTSQGAVVVYGAYGHTGQFVVAELRDRGMTPILAGRDAAKLQAAFPGEEVRPASVDDPGSLDAALAGAAVVINAAGPFAATAGPVIEAALRAGIPYLDVAAEVEAVADTFRYDDKARAAGVTVVPAMAFYGGLGDLLATAAMGGSDVADEIHLAYALSSWKPTEGTRASGRVSKGRRDGGRLVYRNQRLELRTDSAPVTEWAFPAPVGTQAVQAEFTMADSVTIPTHLKASEIHTYMTVAPLADLFDAEATAPSAVDDRGRSDQTFVVEVVVRQGDERRRAVACGQDIYAISAPLVVEATERVLSGQFPAGVISAGSAFDARDFLMSLRDLSVEID